MGGPDMGGLILYGACNGGPGIVRNVPNPAQIFRGNHITNIPQEMKNGFSLRQQQLQVIMYYVL